MDILREKFNGIEYYLIDTYEDEFSFGTVYHFISKDNDEKFCFYKQGNYVPIKNRIYLKKINKELKINTDIIFKVSEIKNIVNKRNKNRYVNAERWNIEKEHKAYDEVSNVIHELFPDISYEDTMEILDDNAGIYFHYLEDGVAGEYHHDNKKIYLDRFIKDVEKIKRNVLHECIHKLTDRKGFLEKYNKHFVGLIEGATEKICEDKYGDKTSHTEVLDGKDIHINFSNDASYSLQQVIYRQMSYILGTKKCDKSIINGQKSFFDEFSNLYGEYLFIYLNHRCNRLLNNTLSEKQKIEYFKEAQTKILQVFDKEILSIQTEKDIINYMTVLRNFEYVTARIEGDTTFQDYYNNSYNFVIQLAKQKGMELSKIEQFKYKEAKFYPERNCEKVRPFEITREHINNLSFKEEIDLSKCKRIQVEPSSNFFNLDIVLQNNIPISIIEDNSSFPIIHIEADDEYFDIIRENFKIEDDGIDIYNIASDTYMIIKKDGTSTIYSENIETGSILSKNEVDLGITLKDIEDERLRIENSIGTSMSEFENKNRIMIVFNNIKNFFKNAFRDRKFLLPEAFTNQLDADCCNESNTNHSSFVKQLDPSNPIYDHSTTTIVKQLEEHKEETLDIEEKIND